MRGKVLIVRIGDLAARSQVSVRSLRYYEEQGLLYSERSGSGQRHYSEQAVERVALIQLLFAAGLSSRTVHQLLPCTVTGIASEEDRALLVAEQDRIDRQMADLARARVKLNEIVDLAFDPTLPCAHVSPE